MTFTLFVIDTLFGLLAMLLLLRAWMQFCRADFYNPFSQFVVRFTQPLVGPLRRVIPAFGSVDMTSMVLAYLMLALKVLLILMVGQRELFFSPIILLGSLLTLCKIMGKLIFWALLLRALLSWISQGRSPVEQVMMQLTEPFLLPIRRLLPNTGGLDFSVMIAMFILVGLNYLGTDLSAMIGLEYFWINQ